jgi:GcrA cell cycle regulator
MCEQSSVWTDAEKDELRELWGASLSTAAIGRMLHRSKNAIIGRAHRLGLPPRLSPIRFGHQSRAVMSPEKTAEQIRILSAFGLPRGQIKTRLHVGNSVVQSVLGPAEACRRVPAIKTLSALACAAVVAPVAPSVPVAVPAAPTPAQIEPKICASYAAPRPRVVRTCQWIMPGGTRLHPRFCDAPVRMRCDVDGNLVPTSWCEEHFVRTHVRRASGAEAVGEEAEAA